VLTVKLGTECFTNGTLDIYNWAKLFTNRQKENCTKWLPVYQVFGSKHFQNMCASVLALYRVHLVDMNFIK
jgi:hypothetical protein